MDSIASKLHKAAAWYAQHGFPVFPLFPRTKKPMTQRGFKDATKDPQLVERWWTREPDANIGIPMGAASGLLLVDLDYRGKSVVAERDDLIRLFGPIPDTAEVITGSGGRHIFFQDQGGKVPKQLAAGVDLKGTGGYAVMAPSIHPNGNEYTFDGAEGAKALLHAAAPPDWLVVAIANGHSPEPKIKSSGGDVAWKIPEIVDDGKKHYTIVSLAGTLRLRNVPLEAAIAACRALRFENPVSDADIRERVENIYENYRSPSIQINPVTAPLSIELLNGLPIFAAGIRFKAIRRRGSMIEASFDDGSSAIWATATDLSSFARSQSILFDATGVLILTPPTRKIKTIWEPIAQYIRRYADQDGVNMEPGLKDEFREILRNVWQRAVWRGERPEAKNDDEFVEILQACQTYRRDPQASQPPGCAVWIAAGYCWIHQPTLTDWLSTPGGKNKPPTWDNLRTALFLLNFVQREKHKSKDGRGVHVRVWQGPLDILVDDETKFDEKTEFEHE